MENKIIYVINTLDVGGAAKMLTFVANLSCGVFDNVSIITMFGTNGACGKLDSRISVTNLQLDTMPRSMHRTTTAIKRIRGILKNERPNFVCSFVSHVAVLVRLSMIGIRNNICLISAERGDPYTQSFLWQKITKWAYSNSDVCLFQLEKARDFFGTKVARKSFVIPNPFYPKCEASRSLMTRKRTIVSVGRFDREKGFDVLIDAFGIIHKKFNDYTLTIYGDGVIKDELQKQVDKLHLTDVVFFPGYVENIEKEIIDDGMFVLPSRFEGIPNSLLEAMSVGLPIISTDCTPGGPAFLTKNGERGLLVEVDNSKSLAEAIERYIKEPEFAERMGEKSKAVIDELDPKLIASKWYEFFSCIIKEYGL